METFDDIYNNYLNIRGFTHRLENKEQRLFYTFQEAVYAIDLSKLTRDEAGLEVNSLIYIVVLNDCIAEFLEEDIDNKEQEKAILFYKKEEQRRAKENQKYHMYQN